MHVRMRLCICVCMYSRMFIVTYILTYECYMPSVEDKVIITRFPKAEVNSYAAALFCCCCTLSKVCYRE